MLSFLASAHFNISILESSREISWEVLLHAAVDRHAVCLIFDYYYCWNYRGTLEFDHYSKRRYLPVSATHPTTPLANISRRPRPRSRRFHHQPPRLRLLAGSHVTYE